MSARSVLPVRRSLVSLGVAIALGVTSAAHADTRRIAAETSLRAAPSASAEAVTTLYLDQEVKVVERSGEWVKIRADTQTGWVRRADLSSDDPDDGSSEHGVMVTMVSEDELNPSAPIVTARSPIDLLRPSVTAALGYRSMGATYKSDAIIELANYTMSSHAATVRLDAAAVFAIASTPIVAGVDGSYQFSAATAQVRDGQVYDASFVTHQVDGGVQAGVALLGRQLVATARVGYHYGVFYIDDVFNDALLARERTTGVFAGVRIAYAPNGKRLAVRVTGDVLPSATLRQTPGIESGDNPSASALRGAARVDYALGARLILSGTYRYERASAAWNGMGTRLQGVADPTRVDTSHAVSAGAAWQF